jgi:DNA (cytosine-5)-methyltransferase 1
MLTVLDLFSGIGGFSLGLERTGGFRTVAFCEIEPYCQAVLRKHWPNVPIFPDVTKLVAADVGSPDVICGGFPCQDVSLAGKQAGIDGKRSGLWREFARLIGEIRPRYAIVENVPGLLSDGMGHVLGDLAALGFDAEWHCVPAAAVGAPHRRDRVWIVSYPRSNKRGCRQHQQENSLDEERDAARIQQPGCRGIDRTSPLGEVVSDTHLSGCENFQRICTAPEQPWVGALVSAYFAGRASDVWRFEPNVGRVADGIPARVDRLRGLGNAVVPQVVEIIGQAILETEAMKGR